MDAGNGLFRVRLPFPGEENLLPICRLCMNIRCTGRKLRKRQKAPEILSEVPAYLLILKGKRACRRGNDQS